MIDHKKEIAHLVDNVLTAHGELDRWQRVVNKAMHDLLWATGGVGPSDPMVVAWQAMREAIEVSVAHEAWKLQLVNSINDLVNASGPKPPRQEIKHD
jgi:hypothetical protein